MDKRSETLDVGNVKMTFNGFVEKVIDIYIYILKKILNLIIYFNNIFIRPRQEKKKDCVKKVEDSES